MLYIFEINNINNNKKNKNLYSYSLEFCDNSSKFLTNKYIYPSIVKQGVLEKKYGPPFNLSNSKLSRHKRHANSAYIFIFKYAFAYVYIAL